MPKEKHVYNKFFDKAKWDNVNPENKEIIEDYTTQLQQEQKSKETIRVYSNDWRIVSILVYDMFKNKSFLKMTKKDWRKLNLYLQEDCGHSNARVNAIMSAIRSIMAYCEDDDDYEYNFSTASKVKGLKKEHVRDIIFIENDDIFKLKDILIEKEEYQKLLFLFLAYDSGGRKNEIYQVKKSVFTQLKGNETNKVVGKRGKEFKLMFFDETIKAAKLYLEQRGEDSLEELWISGDNDNKTPITANTFNNWIEKMMEWLIDEYPELDYLEDMNVHSLRHSSLENLSNNNPTHYALKLSYINKPEGFDLEDLKLHANHTSVETTAGYLKNRDEEKKMEAFGGISQEYFNNI